MKGRRVTGDELLRALAALSNPHRLRLLALLYDGPNYVSQLARDIRLSRPLVHLHLQKLEAAGLIEGRLSISEDGKAMKYFEVLPFAIELTPEFLARAARDLDPTERDEKEK